VGADRNIARCGRGSDIVERKLTVRYPGHARAHAQCPQAPVRQQARYRRSEGDDYDEPKERKASVMQKMSELSADIWGRTPFTTT
jgi:hypothetical protein